IERGELREHGDGDVQRFLSGHAGVPSIGAVRKRLRYESGETPRWRWKTRRSVSALPKPHVAATTSSVSAVSSSSQRAASSRVRSTKRLGVSPTSAAKTRVK